ncbi:MAG: hypothetical protein RI907_990 [Pseudomonadota bacterium]|jgi:hypothetical protein
MTPRLVHSQDTAPSTATPFQRLEAGFAAKGWRLYPLYGEKLMATIPEWGMSRVLNNLAEARQLLLKIGGAA